jgi:hypothetical protein
MHTTVSTIVASVLPGGADALVLDRACAPVLQKGSPIASVYVDNAAIFALSHAEAQSTIDAVEAALHRKGFGTHEKVDATSSDFEIVGLVFNGRSKRLRHKPKRMWRLYDATLDILRRGRLYGWHLRHWLGHAVHLAMLSRPLLSLVSACYAFVS